MSDRRVKFYCKPVNGLATDWSLYSTELYDSDYMETAEARFNALRLGNGGFFWKIEIPEPTYRYRIMAKPRYNKDVEWFPIYKNRTYMTGMDGRTVMTLLQRDNPVLEFKLQEEEVAD